MKMPATPNASEPDDSPIVRQSIRTRKRTAKAASQQQSEEQTQQQLTPRSKKAKIEEPKIEEPKMVVKLKLKRSLSAAPGTDDGTEQYAQLIAAPMPLSFDSSQSGDATEDEQGLLDRSRGDLPKERVQDDREAHLPTPPSYASQRGGEGSTQPTQLLETPLMRLGSQFEDETEDEMDVNVSDTSIEETQLSQQLHKIAAELLAKPPAGVDKPAPAGRPEVWA